MLSSGGDARIALDSQTGLNRYLAAPYPRRTLAFASSTANDISVPATDHLLALCAAGLPSHAAHLGTLRQRIRAAYALDPHVGVVFAPSGTDLEFVALAAVAGRGAAGVHNILLGADEVGSGCIFSARGQYFADETALGHATRPGELVEGMESVTLADVAVRCEGGMARTSAEIADQVRAEVRCAVAEGRHALLHVVHGSKTGLILPKLAEIDALRSEFGDAMSLVVDACQAAAGLPICETARVLDDLPEGGRCQIPSLGRSIGPLSALLQCLLAVMPILIEGRRDLPLENELMRLHGVLAKSNFRSSNMPRFVRAAHGLRLPFRELPGQFLLLGEGVHGRWLDSTFTDATPFIATQLARGKLLGAAHLRLAGLPVPPHRRAATVAEAQAAARALGYPVVVKPADLDGGTGVAAGLQDAEDVARAYEAARRHSASIIVEKHIEGRDYRLTVFQGEVVWAVERVPAGVTGDGKACIAELVAAANADPRRGSGDHAPLKRLMLDDEANALLAQSGISADTVPPAGCFIRLRRAANVASGGMPVAVFERVHPDNAQLAVRAAAALRLDLAGVDLIIPDIARSWREGGAA
ncbi:MAG: putative D-alanine-D-alanine ligase, partial [Porphyrobacter sp. HL-46]